MKRKKLRRFRIQGVTVTEVQESFNENKKIMEQSVLDEAEIARVVEEATAEVDKIIEGGQEQRRFRGKQILKQFYDEVVHGLGFSEASFKIELAREVARRPAAVEDLRIILAHAESYVPEAACRALLELKAEIEGDRLQGEMGFEQLREQLGSLIRRCKLCYGERRFMRLPRTDGCRYEEISSISAGSLRGLIPTWRWR
jgi:hypothetical protein